MHPSRVELRVCGVLNELARSKTQLSCFKAAGALGMSFPLLAPELTFLGSSKTFLSVRQT